MCDKYINMIYIKIASDVLQSIAYSNPQKQHRQKKMFWRQLNALQYHHHTQGQILQGNVHVPVYKIFLNKHLDV